MSVTQDQFLGHGNAAASATCTLTTAQPVAAGAVIVVWAGRFDPTASNDMTLTGGGLTWTKRVNTQVGNFRLCGWTAPAPAGLASGTVLTNTMPGTPDSLMTAESLLGVDTAGTFLTNQNSGTGTGWSCGSVTPTDGDAVCGSVWTDGLVGTSTATVGTEWDDFNVAGQSESMAANHLLSTSGAVNLAGTWSGSTTWIAGVISLPAAASTVTIIDTPHAGHFGPF